MAAAAFAIGLNFATRKNIGGICHKSDRNAAESEFPCQAGGNADGVFFNPLSVQPVVSVQIQQQHDLPRLCRMVLVHFKAAGVGCGFPVDIFHAVKRIVISDSPEEKWIFHDIAAGDAVSNNFFVVDSKPRHFFCSGINVDER